MPMLLLMLCDCAVVPLVVAVVFESEELPKGPVFLDIIMRGWALPLRSVLEKLPLAEPGSLF